MANYYNRQLSDYLLQILYHDVAAVILPCFLGKDNNFSTQFTAKSLPNEGFKHLSLNKFPQVNLASA